MSSSHPSRENPKLEKSAVGRRIREVRGFDLTQGNFASMIGVSQSMLSNYEGGKVIPPAGVLLRIADLAGKSIEWILTGEEEPS